MRLFLLDELFEALKNKHFDLIVIKFIHFIDHIFGQLLHDLLLKVLACHHQVSQSLKAFFPKAMAANNRQL